MCFSKVNHDLTVYISSFLESHIDLINQITINKSKEGFKIKQGDDEYDRSPICFSNCSAHTDSPTK